MQFMSSYLLILLLISIIGFGEATTWRKNHVRRSRSQPPRPRRELRALSPQPHSSHLLQVPQSFRDQFEKDLNELSPIERPDNMLTAQPSIADNKVDPSNLELVFTSASVTYRPRKSRSMLELKEKKHRNHDDDLAFLKWTSGNPMSGWLLAEKKRFEQALNEINFGPYQPQSSLSTPSSTSNTVNVQHDKIFQSHSEEDEY